MDRLTHENIPQARIDDKSSVMVNAVSKVNGTDTFVVLLVVATKDENFVNNIINTPRPRDMFSEKFR